MRFDLFILEGGEQIEEDVRMGECGSALEQMDGLIGSESAAEEESIGYFFYIGAVFADLMCDAIGRELVTAIQHGNRPSQGKFGKQGSQDRGETKGDDDLARL